MEPKKSCLQLINRQLLPTMVEVLLLIGSKLNLNHHLIGEELLDLAENEVPPEDIVFHRFYLNKTDPVKPKAKRKDSLFQNEDMLKKEEEMLLAVMERKAKRMWEEFAEYADSLLPFLAFEATNNVERGNKEISQAIQRNNNTTEVMGTVL